MRTMLWFLADAPPHKPADTNTKTNAGMNKNILDKDIPRIWIVAGFHTGRSIVAGFFETAVHMGLRIERIYERDLNSATEDEKEVRREWVPVRAGEGPENRRRWCVVAVLVKS